MAPPPPSDGPPLLPQPKREPDLIGSVLADRYRVDEVIGDGGMGRVYGGTHVTLRKPVAIKVLKHDLSSDRTLVERFLREARAASMIGHENVVDIVDFGQVPGGSVFFVMERLVGHDLGALLDVQVRLSWMRTRNIAMQVARALHAAHAVGVVHRDMKPGNVFLIQRRGDDDYVKVLDFGIAKVDDPDGNVLTRAGSVFGTAAYMAPEQAAGSSVDGRTDVYSLACVMFEMLTGRLPFPGTNFVKILSQHIKEPPPRPREVAPEADVSDEVEALLMRALAKRPEDRFPDMGAFARAIAEANGEAPIASPRQRPVEVYIPLPSLDDHPAEAALPPDIRTVQHQVSAPLVEERPATMPTADRTVMLANIEAADLAAGVDDHLIAALAFLYVTFAHSTDGQLTSDEMRALADRLHHWAPQATYDQLGAMLRYTIGNYGQFPPADRLAHAQHYADWIAGRGTPAQRQQVLADLQAIAIADGHVSTHEQLFIADIAARLGIPLGPSADERLYALAFLYLAFSGTSSTLTPEEMRTLGNNLRKWAPSHTPEQLAEVLKRAVADFRKLPGDGARLAHARAWADSLKQNSGPEQLRQILADLWALAGADGYVSDDEQRFIMDTAQRFGLV
ncbi:protein kinase domain-containing protein [Nannocystaceae bacterium ST9]